jgi:hypothetical protein
MLLVGAAPVLRFYWFVFFEWLPGVPAGPASLGRAGLALALLPVAAACAALGARCVWLSWLWLRSVSSPAALAGLPAERPSFAVIGTAVFWVNQTLMGLIVAAQVPGDELTARALGLGASDWLFRIALDVLISPVVETLVLVVLVKAVGRLTRSAWTSAATVGIFFGVAHGLLVSWWFVTALVLFATLAFAYLAVERVEGGRRAVAVALGVHVFNNVLAVMLLLGRELFVS